MLLERAWREAADNVMIFENSIAEALDSVAEVIARSAPNKLIERTPDK